MVAAEEGRREGREPPGRRSVLASRVVGRDFEVRALGEALDGATAGRGGVVFLVGEAGIGKSRLAQVTSADAEARGLGVLRGRAVPTSTPVAYRPLAEALCSAVRGGLGADAPELTPFRATLGWLVPEWRGGDDRGPDSVVALAEAVLRFLRVAARDRGCLVVLEDLHWADPETLTILEYVADNLTTEPALCLATLRTEDRSSGLELARALQARRVSQLLEISRLDPDDVAEMVRSCLNVSTVPDQVLDFAARADGVPFLVEELLAVAVTSGVLVGDGESWTVSETVEPVVPLTFSDSMRRRLSTLDGDTRAVLSGAAVLGRRFEWALVSNIAGLGHDAVLAALHDAVDNQILAVDPHEGGFRFRHALSRDAVLGQLLPPERATLSSRALEAVKAAHPSLAGEWCELAAELAERAGDRGRAAGLLLDAGRRALRGGALASAEVTLERARTLSAAEGPTILDVEECLTEVLSLSGKRDRAIEVGESLLARLGDEPGGAPRRAETYLRLARAAVAATDWEEAHRLLERARSQAGPAPDERFTARVNGVAAQTAIMRDPQSAPLLARDALEAAERLDLPEVACEALEILGRVQRPHDLEAAEATFSRALAIADHHALSVWRVRALHELGTIALLHGRPPTRLQEARELAVDQGALATAAVVDVQIAAALAVGEDPEEAAVAARRGADVARRYGLHQTLAAALGFEACAHARTGRRDAMQRCIQEAMAHAPRAADIEVITSFAAVLLAFVEEDRAGLRRHLERAVRPASLPPGGDYSTGPVGGVLALVREVDGDDGQATGPGVAEDPVHFMALAYFRYAEAVAAGRGGDHEGALALLAEGDRVLGDHVWLRQVGRRLVAEAALADRWGDPVAWLRDALSFFDEQGEERIASASRSLLRKAGAPVPRRRAEATVPLTLRTLGVSSRELEVLRLLGQGLANKEIGARLYLSPRTVERHVANLTVKTGVGRRSELVAFAARTVGDIPPV